MMLYKCCSAALMFPSQEAVLYVRQSLNSFQIRHGLQWLTFDFEFICEYCVARLADNKNWMNKFKFEHWIEIKLQLSSKFRLCNLPSSKDFNENKTVARKDELGPGSKSCRRVKCLAGTSTMEKSQNHLPHKTERGLSVSLCLPVSYGSIFYVIFTLTMPGAWGGWGLGHNHGKMSSVFSAWQSLSLTTSRKVSAINSSQSGFLLSLRKMIWQSCQDWRVLPSHSTT